MKKTLRGIDAAVRYGTRRNDKERTITRRRQRDLKQHARAGALVSR